MIAKNIYKKIESIFLKPLIHKLEMPKLTIIEKTAKKKLTLRNEIYQIIHEDPEICNEKAKIDEINTFQQLHEESYYIEKVYIGTLEDFQPEIEFVSHKTENSVLYKTQNDLWEYFRIFTSSISTRRGYGRSVRFFVKDKKTRKYAGIVAIGEDPYAYTARDSVIGWVMKDRMLRIKHVFNIVTCVPLQPFGYNFNGGKLIASLCFSNEVRAHIQEKYEVKVAMINTFGINGKAVQYERLPYLKFAGLTKGLIPGYIPDKILDKGIRIMKEEKITLPSRPGRFAKLIAIMNMLQMSHTEIESGQPRGAYLGFIGDQKEVSKFLRGETKELPPPPNAPAAEIIDWWKKRWALQRSTHLQAENRFKDMSKVEFKNIKKIKSVQAVNASNQKRMEEIGEVQYKKEKAQYKAAYRVTSKHMTEIPLGPSHPEEDALEIEYLAGFFDGQAIIGMLKKNPFVHIVNNDPRILKKIATTYGFKMYTRPADEKAKIKRTVFKIELSGPPVRTMLEDIKDHLVLKASHVHDLICAMDSLDHMGTSAEKANLLDIPWTDKPKHYDRVTWNYVAGLFDAEGSIYMNCRNVVTLAIPMPSDRGVLEVIEKLGFGRLESDGMRVNESVQDKVKQLLIRLLPKLHVLKYQATLALEAVGGANEGGNTRPTKERLNQINLEMKNEKQKDLVDAV